MAPEAADAMMRYLDLSGTFANPASIQHCLGQTAESAIEDARSKIASVFNTKKKDFVFTSGATESNNLAIQGVAQTYRHQGKHIVTSAIEHKSVLDTCKHLESHGFSVTYLRPDNEGRISVDTVLQAITDDTILVSLMYANNETGAIQPIDKLAQALQDQKALFHVDAAQVAGKLPIDLTAMPIDLLSISAHKFYGPKGCGCLYVRNRNKIHLTPIMFGGGQEYRFRLRPGTLPTHQIVAMATALTLAHENMATDFAHCRTLKESLLVHLKKMDGVILNGSETNALPNIVNISFELVGSDALLITLTNRLAISSGSACSSGAIEASHVLRAMGIEGDRLYGAVRISFGRYTTQEDIRQAGEILLKEVLRLRALARE